MLPPGFLNITIYNEPRPLEIGDVSHFRTIKQDISYCGLCGDERSSADKALRMPLSKQRNKHIQRTLVEAAKPATETEP